MIRRLLPTLEATRRQILRQAKKQGASLADDAMFWAAQEAALYAAMIAAMEDAVLMGIDVGMAQLPIAVDWTLVNESAMRWARQYSAELVRRVSATTRGAIREHVANWIESGDPLEALNRKLTPLLGRKRAELVASTEVTRSFYEGNRQIWEQAGVKRVQWETVRDDFVCPICRPLHHTQTELGKPWIHPETQMPYEPPAHPRCRCAATVVSESILE